MSFKYTSIVENYSTAAKQIIDSPIVVAEMFTQSVSDTVEGEGAMFATGEALTGLIPVAGGLKLVKEGAVLKNVGKGKNGKDDKRSNASPSTIDGVKVIDGKVGRKIPTQEFKEIRQSSLKNVDTDSMTLGKYTPTMENGAPNWGKAGPDSYIGKAGNESMYFDLGEDWGKIQEKYNLTGDEMFEYLNVPALDDAVKSGKEIRFSHKPDLKKYENSYLAKEWDYLQENYNYDELVQIGDVWIAK